MVIKEIKLATLVYLLQYGRMTDEEFFGCFNRRLYRYVDKILEIPGVYSNHGKDELYSAYYIISHRLDKFADSHGRRTLKDLVRSPVIKTIDISSSSSIRESFNK